MNYHLTKPIRVNGNWRVSVTDGYFAEATVRHRNRNTALQLARVKRDELLDRRKKRLAVKHADVETHDIPINQ